jgi:hypothetical protein
MKPTAPLSTTARNAIRASRPLANSERSSTNLSAAFGCNLVAARGYAEVLPFIYQRL